MEPTRHPVPNQATEFHRRLSLRLTAVALAGAFGGAGVPEVAEGRVQFRGASCYGETSSNDTDNLVVARPTGTVSGDLMLATITALDHDAPITAPSGWTKILNDDPGGDGTVTFYKVAGGSEPGSYSFFGNDSDIQIASLTSYSGVDPAAPIAPSPVRAAGSGSPWTLPNAASVRWGSMRVTAVASDANVSSTYSAGLTEACDFGISSRAVSSAWERVNAGTTANRTVTRTGTAATIGHTVIVQPLNYCGTGTLALTPPSTISFGSHTLTGFDDTIRRTTPSFAINDQRNSGAGWNLSGTSTTFVNGGRSLDTDATRFTDVDVTPGAQNCEVPSNSVGYPLTLPAGPTAPTATKLYNAAVETGLGPVGITFDTELDLPANARLGTYTSTWTFTLATGP